MTDAARLDAILARLTELEKTSAMAHVGIQSSVDRLGDTVEVLAERVKIQNGRVTKAEHRLSELETKARIDEHQEAKQEDKRDFVREKSWALVTGSFLVLLGAVVGYFL
jgi:hypothetical protein